MRESRYCWRTSGDGERPFRIEREICCLILERIRRADDSDALLKDVIIVDEASGESVHRILAEISELLDFYCFEKATSIMIIALTLTISIAMATAMSSTIIFVFGDSLTDVGNNNCLQSAKSNYPWFGAYYLNGQASWEIHQWKNDRRLSHLRPGWWWLKSDNPLHARHMQGIQ